MQSSGPKVLLLTAVGVILLVSDGSAQGCSPQKAMDDFDADKYLGLWYEVARFGDVPSEEGGRCITSEYTLRGLNDITVHNRMFREDVFIDQFGWANVEKLSSGEAKLQVNIRGVPGPSSYWVLDTDYDSYSIVWTCKDAVETTWILSRNATYSDEQQKNMAEKLTGLSLDLSQKTIISQNPEDCIVKKCGSKDVVYEFYSMEYMGVWYEIARFGHADFENGGRCITVEYTLSGIDNVTIHSRMYNTTEASFSDKEGWAASANPDSKEAKLEVHFPGAPTPYWVLNTDYDSYSIVWACTESETEDGAPSVTETSWILSRTPQLTEKQERQVNERLKDNGLSWSLYTNTTQDPQQCLTRVSTCVKPALDDFAISKYVDQWFEIARFGEVPFEQDGRCITVEYQLAGKNNVTIHSRVYTSTASAGGFSDVTVWAEFDDPDSEGAKLTLHLPDVSGPIHYWVLDTDYETYSIVWACIEPTDEISNITEASWILSRNATLTEEQEQLVNEKLTEKGLSRSRYTNTPQDPQQCLPRVTTCDKPALKHFDISKFAVDYWNEIARFGEVPFEQGGQCIAVTYELAGEADMSIDSSIFNSSAGRYTHVILWAEFDDPASEEAKFTVRLPGVPEPIHYWVLDTDYDIYSIVWACIEPTDDTSNITEASWILSRNSVLHEDQERVVKDKLEALGLSWGRYTKTPQDWDQCRVSDSTECDKPALKEFSLSKFLGTWYELARLGEVPFEQSGRCITVEYQLAGESNVTVNSRMFTEAEGAFSDVTGWATLDDSASGEAKLTAHFPGLPGTTPYWVLDTDYENYAVVWACNNSTNKTSESTRTSWILSRRAQLTDAERRLIEERLEALDLYWGLYTETPQDWQQCAAPGSEGCGMPARAGFSLTKYLGTWYEIARLGDVPFERDGRCITVEYLLAGENNVTVNNTMFTEAAEDFTNVTGWAELDDPSSGFAKMTVHLPTVSVTTSYWVLDTDYTNYSIVWSCGDPTDKTSNNTESSWLLSRTSKMSNDLYWSVNARLEALGLSRDLYKDTQQHESWCRKGGSSGNSGAAIPGPALSLSLLAAIVLLLSA